MILTLILAALTLLSFALLVWQVRLALRFPLHQRIADPSFIPAVTLLKSLKGHDDSTEDCLRSWFAQDYAGPVQILFGVAAADDPVCEIVRKLIREFPGQDAQLIVCGPLLGTNAKVSKLAELEKLADNDVLVISDADVRVPRDFLSNAVAPLNQPNVGLVNCFYRLANPSTLAMQWEAIAINADFWSQVLQSQSLKPLDFALGAVMVTRRPLVQEIGGFQALADCLADDYQLGHRIALKGHRIALCPVVVECWDPPMDWRAVWQHQLRWARTIRVCQPLPYFFSILSNVTFWATLWLIAESPGSPIATSGSIHHAGGLLQGQAWGAAAALLCIILRTVAAERLQRRLTQSTEHQGYFWMTPIKDLLQAAIWFCAFAGNTVEWRGQKFALRHDGTMVKN